MAVWGVDRLDNRRPPMLSFFGEPALKAAVRHRVAEHRRLDQITQGTYWNDGKGCFIGCSLHSSRHEEFETLLGLPVWLAYLGENIFECLPRMEALDFPLKLYDSIPVGADLEVVKAKFLAWLILDEEHGVCRFTGDERVLAVGRMWDEISRGVVYSDDEWSATRNAAWDATRAAAGDAALAAAGDAAWDATRNAAWDATRAAARNAARAAAIDAASAAERDAAWAAAWAAARDAAGDATRAAARSATRAAARNAAGDAAGDAAWAAVWRAQATALIRFMREIPEVHNPQTPDTLFFTNYYNQVLAEAQSAS